MAREYWVLVGNVKTDDRGRAFVDTEWRICESEADARELVGDAPSLIIPVSAADDGRGPRFAAAVTT
jgi:hypothetical protein